LAGSNSACRIFPSTVRRIAAWSRYLPRCVALLSLGDLEGARRHIEHMLGRYVARRSDIIRFQYDQRSSACSYYSLILWLQGFAEQAMRSIECNLVDARTSDHAMSLSNALAHSACPVALLVGDLTLAECYAKALMDLSARHTLRRWDAIGRCFEGVWLIKTRRHWRRVGASAHRVRPPPSERD
jgi:hypothetical protein